MRPLEIRDGPADTAVIAEYEATRREAVGRGLAAGAGVLAAASVPFLLDTVSAFAGSSGDADVLERALGLEQAAVFAYRTVAAGGKLGPTTRVARLFAEQEQEHADALTRAVEAHGGTPPAKPARIRDVPGLEVAAEGTATDILTFAVELETMATKAYYEAQGRLRAPRLVLLSATIMAADAQHLVVLRQALKRNPSPHAFVTGSAS